MSVFGRQITALAWTITLMLALSGLTRDSYAQQFYTSDYVWSTGPANMTRAVAVGDVDRDGDLDVVFANYVIGITLYWNEGGLEVFGTLPEWPVTLSESTSCVVLGDVNGDGWLDLVCGNDGQPNRLYLNSNGVFSEQPVWSSTDSNFTRDIALGDIDYDGKLDLVCGNNEGNNTLYLNVGGDTVFTKAPTWESDLANNTFGIALGDVDGDGYLDLACGNDGQRNTLYLNDGNSAFSDSSQWLPADSTDRTFSVALGDVDGDGLFDLVCGNVNDRNALYLNTGSALNTVPEPSSGPQHVTASVALGDVDTDGDLDLVCGNVGQGNTLYVNNGGTFSASPDWLSEQSNKTYGIALGDVDGDGDLDAVCGNEGQINTLYTMSGRVMEDTTAWLSDLSSSTFGVALGDVDRDGDLDIVFGNGGFKDESNTLYRNRDGVLDSMPEKWWPSDSSSTIGVVLGDVNGDNLLDLVCGNAGTGGQSNALYLNGEDGFSTEQAPWSPETLHRTMGVALGDIDNDGDLDLVCGNGGILDEVNTLFENVYGVRGDAVFSTTPIWESTEARMTVGVVLGDVDGDGDLDLVCGNNEANNTLYLNVGGDNVFANAPTWESGRPNNTFGVALGDVDGDGDLDLVCANGGSVNQGNTLYLNEGGSSVFSTRPVWTSDADGSSTFTVALGDVDGDGDLDLACGNGGTNAQANAIYLNVGFPTFFTNAPVWRSQPARSLSVVLGDIDGDGDLDLLSGNEAEQNALYLGARNPPFKGDPRDPTNHLPNNGAFLRFIRVKPLVSASASIFRVIFTAVDVESDPVWVLPEYQYEGDPTWFPVEVSWDGSSIDTFLTSPDGVKDSLDWDTSGMPFDPHDRAIVLRVRTMEIPRRVSFMQHVASYVKAVGRIPSIDTHPLPSDSTKTEFNEGGAITVKLSLPMGTTSNDARLYFRRGGEEAYRRVGFQVGFQDGDPRPFATISGEWVGARGIEYWVGLPTAADTLTDPRILARERPRTIRITTLNQEEANTHPAEQYRLMSVPIELEDERSITVALEDNIGFPDPMRWRMFLYDALDSIYVEVPNGGHSSFEQGRGYWLITRPGHRLDTDPVRGTSTPTDSAFAITLAPGHNLIGHPFAFPVAWDSVKVDGRPIAEVDVEPPVAVVGNAYVYDTRTLKPWDGYWVKNLAGSAVVLQVPPIEAASSTSQPVLAASSKKGVSEGEWTIGIRASSMGALDTYNYVGVKPGASTVRDKHDRSEAPMAPGRSISLAFPHRSWVKHAGDYTVDIRGAYEELDEVASVALEPDLWGHVWRFDVAKSFSDGTAGDEVLLEFSGVEEVNAGAMILLVDRELQRVVDLKEQDRYAFFQGKRGFVTKQEDARFVLLVGSDEFVNSHGNELPELPTRTVLHQNYPNPFNPSTIIRYELAHPGHVVLRIYDVTGALVKVLEDRDREPGRYEAGWGGENERGGKVSSGVYFYKLVAGDFTQTKKMILLK